MTRSDFLSDPSAFAGALHDLGDDEGRPMARTPEEQLAAFQVSKRRRRTAQLSIAAVAVCGILGAGAAWGGALRPTASISTQAAGDDTAQQSALGKAYVAMQEAGSARVVALNSAVVFDDSEKPQVDRSVGVVDLRSGDGSAEAAATSTTLAVQARRVGDEVFVHYGKPKSTSPGSSWFSGPRSSGPGLPVLASAEAQGQLRDATTVREVGSEQVGGAATTHVTALVTGGQVEQLDQVAFDGLPASARSANVPIDVWLDDANRVRRLSIPWVYSVGEKRQAWLTLDFSDFGTTVNVQKPPADSVSRDGWLGKGGSASIVSRAPLVGS